MIYNDKRRSNAKFYFHSLDIFFGIIELVFVEWKLILTSTAYISEFNKTRA